MTAALEAALRRCTVAHRRLKDQAISNIVARQYKRRVVGPELNQYKRREPL